MKSKNQLLTFFFLLFSTSILQAQDCDNDVTPPNVICFSDINLIATEGTGITFSTTDIDANSFDDCGPVTLRLTTSDEDTGVPPTTTSVTIPPVIGTYIVVMYAIDPSGNWNNCFSEVNIVGINDGSCDDDNEPPSIFCITGLTAEITPGTSSVTIFAQDIIQSFTENCDPNPNFSINLITESTGAPQGQTSISFDAPAEYPVEVWAVDDAGNSTFCETFIHVIGDGSAPCENDNEAPTAVCDQDIMVSAIPDFGVILWAQDIDEGSYDNCSDVQLTLNLFDDNTGTPPTSSSIQLPAVVADYMVVLYVEDSNGNFNNCFTQVSVTDLNNDTCTTDEEAPVIACESSATATLSPGASAVFFNAFELLDVYADNCTVTPTLSLNLLNESTGAPSGNFELALYEVGDYVVEVWATDQFGNSSACLSTVTVNSLTGDCNNDIIAPNVVCISQLNLYADPLEDNVIWAEDINQGSFDWCSDIDLRIVLASESTGSLPTTTSVIIPPVAGTYPVEMWAVDASGNANYCLSEIVVVGVLTQFTGQVFMDINDNCDLDAGETGLAGWTVLISSTNSNRTRQATTNSEGIYSTSLNWSEADLTNLEVQLLLPNGITSGCVSSITIPEITEPLTTINFSAVLVDDCTYLTVDVAAPLLRRCFQNQVYVNYANYSSLTAENAYINIDLDPFMTLTGASVPFINLGNGQYQLDLGNIPPASAGSITLTATLSCEAQLGATHCVQASIQPFTCIPASSFAELSVTGECDPGTGQVNFTIANTGNSDMTTAQNYRIVEDVIMYMNQNPVQLNAGQSEAISFPANGATWRLEIEQDDSYPFGGIAAAFVEGCGGFTPGIATQFLLENTKPNIDQLCIENIGSWDPNDKQALPRGYGEQHFIEANSPLEYLIRFQNTGTDTAFNIRIEDQLSEHLDISSLVPGASSHPYRMELKEDGQLLFHFDDILLPDSTTNFEASNGFVQFAIRQLPDNPIGTIIENTADIYFDFNEAVVTNTVTHTIGEDFILVATQDVLVPGLTLNVAPNPLHSSSLITLQGLNLNDGQCLIYDTQGRLLSRHTFTGQQLILQRDGFPNSGLYFFRLFDGSLPLAQGKLIVK